MTKEKFYINFKSPKIVIPREQTAWNIWIKSINIKSIKEAIKTRTEKMIRTHMKVRNLCNNKRSIQR